MGILLDDDGGNDGDDDPVGDYDDGVVAVEAGTLGMAPPADVIPMDAQRGFKGTSGVHDVHVCRLFD